MYYYNYNVCCDIYVLNGVVATDEEGYAESYDDLVEYVNNNFEDIYEYTLDDIGGIYIKINYTDDPAYKGTEQDMNKL